MSNNSLAALVCATGLWVACIGAALHGSPKRPAGEAWVVTASDKIPSRPMLIRANVKFATAAADTADGSLRH